MIMSFHAFLIQNEFILASQNFEIALCRTVSLNYSNFRSGHQDLDPDLKLLSLGKISGLTIIRFHPTLCEASTILLTSSRVPYSLTQHKNRLK